MDSNPDPLVVGRDRERRKRMEDRTIAVLYEIPLEIEQVEEGQYLASSPVLPGLHVMGESREKVLELAPGVASALLAAMRERGIPIPAELRPD